MSRAAGLRAVGAGALATVMTVSALLVTSTSGSAAPQRDLAQVEEQVRDLEMRAGAAHEEAERAAENLRAVRQKLETVTSKLTRERREVRETEALMGDLARSLYSSGGLDPTLQVLLAEDPVEFLAQSAVLDQVAESQGAQIRQAQTARLRLAQTEAEVADQEAQASDLEAERSAAEVLVRERLQEATEILEDLQADERARLARIRAERAQEQRVQARELAAEVSAEGAGGDEPGAEPGTSGGGYTGGSRAQRAVEYALSQVGDPYSYSANPPSSWDCSKLTAAAWGQAGVGLTALSYTQWDQTRRVPVSEIQPGDLVFYFGRGAHHVSIYVGNGKMVSASNPSDGVELIDFLGPWYKERFSGVGRVIG